MEKGKAKKRGRGGTLKTLGVLVLLALVLAGYHAFSQSRELALATGPATPAQKAFFITAADRPDIEQFFKNLSPAQRLAIAARVGDHSDPKIATLIGKLLTTFDADARILLTESLIKLGKTQPEAVSRELKHAGSFQRLAVFKALREMGDPAIPIVAERLKDADTRPNAIVYLVEEGEKAVAPLLSVLRGDSKDGRLAAADALAKLDAEAAVQDLLRLYRTGEADEKPAYLVALATIGAPEGEAILLEAFRNEDLPPHLRSQAALGLGRISSKSALSLLWKTAAGDVSALKQSAVAGLQLAGDSVFTQPAPADKGLFVEVLSGIQTPASTQRLLQHLKASEPKIRLAALNALTGRNEAVVPLRDYLVKLDIEKDGAEIDASIAALSASSQGLAALRAMRSGPFKAAIDRQLALIGHDA